ncbi:hypothetical protein [Streptomyces sp. NPDC015125]
MGVALGSMRIVRPQKDAVDFATKMESDEREVSYVDPSASKVSVQR